MNAWIPAPLPALSGAPVAPPAEERFTGPDAAEILASWTQAGLRWLSSQTRSQLRSVLSRLAEPAPGGKRLYQQAPLFQAVVQSADERLSPSRAASALRHAVFQLWPVPNPVVEPLASWVRAGWPHQPPPWFRPDYATLPQALWVTLERELAGGRLSPEAVTAVLWRMGVPSSFWRGSWVEPLVEAGLAAGMSSVPQVALLVQLCDRNRVVETGAPIGVSHQKVVRAAVQWASTGSRLVRSGVAKILVGRLGSPVTATERWTGLRAEAELLRSWCMEAFLVDVWAPMTGRTLRRPAGDRRDTWALYKREIVSVHLLVSPDVAKSLSPDLLLGTEGTVHLQEVRGLGKGVAALWLTLRQGRMAATVLEWANQGQFQIRTGEHHPAASLQNAQALCWAGWEHNIAPDAYWQDKLMDRLGWAGVRVAKDPVPE